MQKYGLYLFDFDGTLVDSIKSLIDVFVLAFRQIGVEIEEKNCLQYTRQPLEITYEEVHAPWEKVDEFVDAIRFYLNDTQVLKKTEIFDDTIPFLNKMHEKGIRFGIVTSNSEEHVLDVLDLFHIPPSWFEIFVDSDKVRETKPSPKPILYALEELGYMNKRKEVVYVGDGLNDMISANNAGVDAVLIDRVNHFPEADNYVKIKNLFELLD